MICQLCKTREATHYEDGRSRRVSPAYPVCGACAADMDAQERGASPLDRTHHVTRTPVALSLERQAVALGAMPGSIAVAPNGVLSWLADEDRVSITRITYDPRDGVFAGWSGAKPLPEWEH